ncbi:MAG TPA: hypothetical protein VF789_16405 [Thermoanaerobaculia bacterium]
MAATPRDFERDLFINCPFDTAYLPLLQCLIFTVLECGFRPRIALEGADSGQVRFQKIQELIRSCRFSIHDLSRIEPLHSEDLPRFNMPFELGLDLGGRYFGNGRLTRKQCLILERERYRYQKVLSDIAGNDIRAHEGDPAILVLEVRNWLRVAAGRSLPSGSSIWERFSAFKDSVGATFHLRSYSSRDIEVLEIVEYMEFIRNWQANQPAPL